MKYLIILITFICVLQISAQDAVEFRTIEVRNDQSVGGEFHLDLQVRITSGTSPRTLNSLNCDVYYTSQLTTWGTGFPGTNWAFGSSDGYARSANENSGFYNVTVTGNGVNENGDGTPAGWNVTTSWQTIVTLRWYINEASSVNISIYDANDAAGYFNNIANSPPSSVTPWVVSNQDLGDVSLPVQMSNIEAESTVDGIMLTWETASEVNSLGFHVWRSDAKDGDYERITTSLIAGQGNSSAGAVYSFTDRNYEGNATYYYRIEQVDADGGSEMFSAIEVTALFIPTEYALSQNYPNPFNPMTTFTYDVPEVSDVTIKVYSLLGKEVRTIYSKQQMPGRYTQTWDGTDNTGRKLASGVYFLRMQAGSFSKLHKMTLIR